MMSKSGQNMSEIAPVLRSRRDLTMTTVFCSRFQWKIRVIQG